MSEMVSDVEARAQRRRTRTRAEQAQELATITYRRGQAATDPAEARRWLERAHRLAPSDAAVSLSLASSLLAMRQLDEATTLFRAVAVQQAAAEAWMGVAACAHMQGDAEAARQAVALALRRRVLGPSLIELAEAIAGPPAWCGVDGQGRLLTGAPIRTASIDGVHLPLGPSARSVALPHGWREAGTLVVTGAHGPMLGSPLPLAALGGLEAFVAARGGGLDGWAWHPADPAADPVVRLEGPLGARELRLTERVGAGPGQPWAQRRALKVSPELVAALGEPIAVRGPGGRHALGSPLEPTLEQRAATGIDRDRFAPVWADVVGPPDCSTARPGVDVVIPVYRGVDETMACLESVLASVPRGTRVIVVEDASPEPALVATLQGLARRRRIVLVRLAENLGFPGAANAGIRAAAGRDVVLLNSDTLVPPGWLGRLRAAAYAQPGTGTATALSNDATILSYPDPDGANPVPDLAEVVALDGVAQAANAGQTAEVPVGVGFCLYVRRACLDATGLLREDLFAQGYGEENDFCLRARHRGFRHVAALDVFVGHVGGASFSAGAGGGARAQLMARNGAVLERLHPGYDALVAEHVARDPLRAARRRMDELRWANGRMRGALAIVTHAGGGGVERVVRERAGRAAHDGTRAIVLRPTPGGLVVGAITPGGLEAYPNLRFDMPGDMRALAKFLRADRVRVVEVHHLLGHHHEVTSLARRLRAEAVSVVHDFARFCPRISLGGTGGRYCGEPDVAGCEACIADLGSLLEDDPPVRTLLARSAAELAAAARVVAPSLDAATRIGRHFPGVAAEVAPWEDDAGLPQPRPTPRTGALRVVVVGGIGIEKGYDVLLACARDAQRRRLQIDFVVVGYTVDDERLMAAGPVFVTGEFSQAEAVDLIAAQQGHLALIPSVVPETWCFALGQAWQAGLPAVVFDLGAQGERVRATGRGWTMPLGMSPGGLNDAMLRLAPGGATSQCPAVAVPRV